MTSMIYMVSGAGRGIGFELARQLLSQGHTVIATVRKDAGALEKLASSSGERLKILKLDISNDAGVARFRTDFAGLGLKHVDVLINNAGVYLDGEDTIENLKSETLIDTLNVNTVGPMRVTQAMLGFLRESKAPKIAFLSSLMGSVHDNTSGGSFAYRMSKSALNMFVKTLACDEREITSIALHPGWVKTEMGGARAPLSPEKSAEGLITVIQSAGIEDSGKFLNHAGRELPW